MALTKDELTALLAMVSHKLISALLRIRLQEARTCPGVDLGALALKLQWLVDNYA